MTILRRFSTVTLAFLLTLVSALPVSAGSIINAASVILSQNCTTANAIPYLTTASTTAAVLDCSNLVQSANSLDLYNAANVQSFGWYTTRTDASNYERGRLFGVAGTGITIAAETAGSGGDNLGITLTPAGTGGTILTSGALSMASGTKISWASDNATLTHATGSLTSNVPVQFPVGSSSAPAIGFGALTEGLYWDATGNDLYIVHSSGTQEASIGGGGLALSSDHTIGWLSGVNLGGGMDTVLTRADVATPYFRGSSTAVGATLRLGNTNVGYEDFARNSEAHTLAAAGTSTTATAVWPANSSSQAASFRITTGITGCTSVQVGVSGDTTRYGTFTTLTAGQTIAIGRVDNYTVATGILFTCVGGGASFTAGVVRTNLRYITASASTS